MYVVYLFVQPVILVLLFRYVFGGAINTGNVSYVNYLMPGSIVMTAFALVLAFAYVFSWISALIGVKVRDPETAQSVGFIWVFPLVFASSAFVPTDSMPGAPHTFADVNGTVAWLVVLLLVFVPLSVRAFRQA